MLKFERTTVIIMIQRWEFSVHVCYDSLSFTNQWSKKAPFERLKSTKYSVQGVFQFTVSVQIWFCHLLHEQASVCYTPTFFNNIQALFTTSFKQLAKLRTCKNHTNLPGLYSPMFAKRHTTACTSAPAYTSDRELTTGKQSVCTRIRRSPKRN